MPSSAQLYTTVFIRGKYLDYCVHFCLWSLGPLRRCEKWRFQSSKTAVLPRDESCEFLSTFESDEDTLPVPWVGFPWFTDRGLDHNPLSSGDPLSQWVSVRPFFDHGSPQVVVKLSVPLGFDLGSQLVLQPNLGIVWPLNPPEASGVEQPGRWCSRKGGMRQSCFRKLEGLSSSWVLQGLCPHDSHWTEHSSEGWCHFDPALPSQSKGPKRSQSSLVNQPDFCFLSLLTFFQKALPNIRKQQLRASISLSFNVSLVWRPWKANTSRRFSSCQRRQRNHDHRKIFAARRSETSVASDSANES